MDFGLIDPNLIREAAFNYLKIDEIVKACKSNSYFNNALCRNNEIWKLLWERDFSKEIVPKDYKTEYQDAYKILKKSNNINETAAEYGWEKQLKIPYDPAKILAVARIRNTPNIVRKVFQDGYTDYGLLIIAAADVGDFPLVEKLVNSHEIKVDYLLSALYYSLQKSYFDISDLLVKFIPRSSIANTNGIYSYIADSVSIDVLNRAIRYGARNFNFLLYDAAKRGNKEFVERILQENGIRQEDYNQAITVATENGYYDIADMIQRAKDMDF